MTTYKVLSLGIWLKLATESLVMLLLLRVLQNKKKVRNFRYETLLIILFISRENTSCDYAYVGQLPGRGGIEKALYHKQEDECILYFHILLCTFLKYLLQIYGFSNRIFDYLHVAICAKLRVCIHVCYVIR